MRFGSSTVTLRALGLAGAILLAVCGAAPARGYSGSVRGVAVHQTAGAAATAGASDPRAAVCAALAAGPSTAPAGAVTVDPAVVGDLSTKTANYPAGTTFWLAPGVHTLGPGTTPQVIPKNGDTYLGSPGAAIDGQGVNQFAFTQHAEGVTLRYLTIRNFNAPQNQGVVNHDSGNGWVIADDLITANHGAGLMAGAGEQVLRNCLSNNGQYGINAYQAGDGITNLLVQGNEIVGNNTDNWEITQPGCGCTGGVKFWAVNGATVQHNWVHANHSVGLWADTDNNDFLLQDNYIENNDSEGLIYETSYNLTLTGNTLIGNAVTTGKSQAAAGDNFPVGAVYLSESGGDSRVPARTAAIEISNNLFDDNWSGIVAWENADRFCNSPANSSAGYCTKVGGASLTTCAQPGIATAPLYDDCRWKTQNLDIHDNIFDFDPGAVGCASAACGWMALMSNYGSYPSWSPYQGTVIEQAITFNRNNHWHDNSYIGPWQFMTHDIGTILSSATWTAAPYAQDPGSTFSTSAPTNVLDPGTSGGEGGIGKWTPWYSATVQPTTNDPHSGTGAIQVNVTAAYGWGIQLSNYPGFPVSQGTTNLSFCVRAGSTSATGSVVSLNVVLIGPDGQSVTGLVSPALTGNWQQATANIVVPVGTTNAFLTFTGQNAAGSAVVLDDIALGP